MRRFRFLIPACAVAVILILLAFGCDSDLVVENDGRPVDPEQVGPFAVQRNKSSIPWLDQSDQTEISSLVFQPENSPAIGLLVFNHGFASSGEAYASFGEHLASHGFAVVMPTYDAGLADARTHVELAKDVSAVLDVISDRGLFPVLSTANRDLPIGVLGHSRGGKQAIHAAILDRRITAVFGIDPVDAKPPVGEYPDEEFPSVTPELMPGLTVPTLLVGTGMGGNAGISEIPCAPKQDNYERYFEATTNAQSMLVEFVSAGHSDFLDLCAENQDLLSCSLCEIGETPEETLMSAKAMATAFFKWQLLESDQDLEWLNGLVNTISSENVLVQQNDLWPYP